MSVGGGPPSAMNPAVIAVIAVVVVGAAIWRATSSKRGGGGRARTLSMIARERRRHARVVPPPDKPAELQIIGQDFLEIPEVRDISDQGLAVSVPHKFNGHKPTQEVELLLTLHGQGTLRARGAIRHVSYTRSDTATFGVELVAIEDQDREKIRHYLADVERGGAAKPAAEAPRTTPASPAAAARSRK